MFREASRKAGSMKEEEKERKKRRKQLVALGEEEIESKEIVELVNVLEGLKKKGKYVDLQVCPQCKSPRVHRVGTMSGNACILKTGSHRDYTESICKHLRLPAQQNLAWTRRMDSRFLGLTSRFLGGSLL